MRSSIKNVSSKWKVVVLLLFVGILTIRFIYEYLWVLSEETIRTNDAKATLKLCDELMHEGRLNTPMIMSTCKSAEAFIMRGTTMHVAGRALRNTWPCPSNDIMCASFLANHLRSWISSFLLLCIPVIAFVMLFLCKCSYFAQPFMRLNNNTSGHYMEHDPFINRRNTVVYPCIGDGHHVHHNYDHHLKNCYITVSEPSEGDESVRGNGTDLYNVKGDIEDVTCRKRITKT